MAITQNTYTGNGSTTNYSFTFPYLEATDIKASINGTPTTAFTLANATTVSFNTAPANGASIRIYRETDDAALAATFYPGSAIRSQDLNDNFSQNLYVVQEINNNALQIDGTQTMLGDLDMGGQEIINIGAATTASSLVTKGYVDGYINTYYLGGSASDPATRPGGSPLQSGDYYVNTNNYQFKYWNGSQWRDVDYATEQDRIAAQSAQAAAESARDLAQTARTGAETAKVDAQTARDLAQTAQAGAQTARSGAETARDAALLNADIYPTTAAGIAATAVGGYFQTYSGNSNEYLILYRVDAGPVATLIKTYPSSAFFSFFQFQDGYLPSGTSQYYAAWVDSYKRFSFGIQPDGTLYAQKFSAASITAPGGSIDLDSIDTPKVGINGAGTLEYMAAYAEVFKYSVVDANKRILFGVDSSDSLFAVGVTGHASRFRYLDGKGYHHAVTDANKRIALGVKDDGAIIVPSNAIETGSAAATSTALFTAERVLGDYEIFSYSNGNRSQLTFIGSNYEPVVTQESPSRILFKSNRTGSVNYHVMNQDGSKQALAQAPTTYAMWGDSQTGNLRGIIANNGHTVVTQAFLDKGLTSYDKERRVINVGIGSQTAVQIAARQGGLTTTCVVTGSQIPASGSVNLTSVYPDLLYNPTLDARLTNFPATINGVSGTLARVDATNYTFTRSVSGSVVAASGTTTIVPNTADASPIISVDLFAPTAFTGADLNEYTAIFWLGHNGVGGSNGETLLGLINGCVAALRNISKRFLILPIFNATTESGTPSYTSLQTNSWSPLANAYPVNYYDIRADFIASAKTWMQANYPASYASDWGLAYTTGGDIRAVAGTDSDYDISKDMIPRALRADIIHLNEMGKDLFSELLATKLKTLGW